MSTIKFVKKEITVATAIAASARPDSFLELPKDFNRVTGMCVVEITGGDLDRNYDLGLQAVEGADTIDMVNASAFGVIAPDTDVDPKNRFRDDVQFDITAARTKIKLETFGTTSGELKLQVIFRCEKFNNC